MASSSLFQVFFFVSLMVSGNCIAGTNELEGFRQGGDGYIAMQLMLKFLYDLETDMQELKSDVKLKAEVADIQELKAEVEDTHELKADIQDLKAEVADIQELNAEVKDTQELKADIQELKAEVADIQELKAEVEDTQELKADTQKLKADIQELKAEVEETQELKADMQELKAEVADIQELRAEVANIVKLKAEIEGLKATYKDQPKTIFAQMQLLEAHTYQPGDRVYFTSTVANVGNAYDIHHGYFEAPYDGTYLFSVTLCTSPGNSVLFHIVQDDNNIRESFTGDSSWHTCASSTAVTQMKSGSRVWVEIVRAHKGKIESAWGIPSFTGVFLNNYQKP